LFIKLIKKKKKEKINKKIKKKINKKKVIFCTSKYINFFYFYNNLYTNYYKNYLILL